MGPQDLADNPRVALVSNDAIGNYVVLTPLIQMLHAELSPWRLDYYSGTRTREFWKADDRIDFGFPLHGSDPREAAKVALDKGPYDLVVNVEQSVWAKGFTALLAGEDGQVVGPCVDAAGRKELPFQDDERGRLWEDKRWIADDLPAQYPFLRSGFIGEIFARLCYLQGDLPPYQVPSEEPFGAVPEVLVATAASLPEKLWPIEKWKALLGGLGRPAGLLGAKPSAQKAFWKGAGLEEELVESGLLQDLRGEFSLPEVAGALAKARLVVTIDNGILHLAVAAGTPTVGLFRHGIHRLWAPPSPSLHAITPGEGGEVADISVATVLEACRRAA